MEHSRILNDKAMNGTLCLSIHPMDYITMSDNDSNWSSCMSWTRGGGYRGGTVECMNSTNTLVAYLESEDNPCSFLNYADWNNKKWRCLFVVNPDVITSVKSYPYHNNDILDIVIKWLAELAKENWGGEVDTNTIVTETDGVIYLKTELGTYSRRKPYMYFETNGVMYNDFGCATNHHYVLSNEFKAFSLLLPKLKSSCMIPVITLISCSSENKSIIFWCFSPSKYSYNFSANLRYKLTLKLL